MWTFQTICRHPEYKHICVVLIQYCQLYTTIYLLETYRPNHDFDHQNEWNWFTIKRLEVTDPCYIILITFSDTMFFPQNPLPPQIKTQYFCFKTCFTWYGVHLLFQNNFLRNQPQNPPIWHCFLRVHNSYSKSDLLWGHFKCAVVMSSLAASL